MVEKKFKAEGSFSFELREVSKLSAEVFSPIHSIGGFDWRIGVERNVEKDQISVNLFKSNCQVLVFRKFILR